MRGAEWISLRLSLEIVATAALSRDATTVIFASCYLGSCFTNAPATPGTSGPALAVRMDSGREVRELIRRQLRYLNRSGAAHWLTARGVNAVEKLARSDACVCPAGPFDAKPSSLETPADIVDPRNSTRRDHPITKLVSVTPDFGGTCPVMLQLFLLKS